MSDTATLMPPDLSPNDLTDLTAFRHALHRRPELSGAEEATARAVVQWLEQTAPDRIITGLGGHGVAAVYDGRADGPTILLRSELDALPIAEQPGPDHQSQFPGVAHLCGHDGHTAILCAVARRLTHSRPATGRVVLLFQPAEETGAGARSVLADPKYAEIAPDWAFALHNLPGLETGHVRLRSGTLCCASRGMHVNFTGRTAHASQPETGLAPTRAICDLIEAAEALSHGDVTDPNFALVTVVHARIGEPAFGVAPGAGEVMLTLRTAENAAMARLVTQCEALAKDLSARDHLGCAISYADIFEASVNDAGAVAEIERALTAEGIPFATSPAPMRWSEDFGAIGAQCRGAMFLIGSGTGQPDLHNPDYDFPDALIEPASRIFSRILVNLLGEPTTN